MGASENIPNAGSPARIFLLLGYCNVNSYLVYIVLALATLSTMLSGCATGHRLYVAPENGNVAYLRVVDSEGQGLPGKFLISTFENPVNCERRVFLQGIASQLRQTDVTLSYARIESGKPFPLVVNASVEGDFLSGSKSCVIGISFVPQENRFYTATLAVDKKACYLSLRSAATEAGDQSRAESGKKLLLRTAFFSEDSSFCISE